MTNQDDSQHLATSLLYHTHVFTFKAFFNELKTILDINFMLLPLLWIENMQMLCVLNFSFSNFSAFVCFSNRENTQINLGSRRFWKGNCWVIDDILLCGFYSWLSLMLLRRKAQYKLPVSFNSRTNSVAEVSVFCYHYDSFLETFP